MNNLKLLTNTQKFNAYYFLKKTNKNIKELVQLDNILITYRQTVVRIINRL